MFTTSYAHSGNLILSSLTATQFLQPILDPQPYSCIEGIDCSPPRSKKALSLQFLGLLNPKHCFEILVDLKKEADRPANFFATCSVTPVS